jgi:hypothetical protein
VAADPARSTWREVQEALYRLWFAEWVDADGEPLTPTQLGNERFDAPDGPWVQLLVQRRPGGPGTLGRPGNRRMDRRGVVFVLLREPPGGATGAMSDRAERAARVYENRRVEPHGIHFAEVEPGQAGDVGGGRWYGVAVEGAFGYEELR